MNNKACENLSWCWFIPFTFFFSFLKPGLCNLPFCKGHHLSPVCLAEEGRFGNSDVQVYTNSKTVGALSPFKAVCYSQDPSLCNQNTATYVSAWLTLQGALPRPSAWATGPTTKDPLVHASSWATATVWRGTDAESLPQRQRIQDLLQEN